MSKKFFFTAEAQRKKLLTTIFTISKFIKFIGIQRFVMMEHLKDQRKAYRHFGSGDGKDENEHDLTVGLTPPRTGDDEHQSGAVEHDLNRHQHENNIPSNQ